MTARYAIWFAPAADHPLWTAGCTWLGRDPATGALTNDAPHRRHPRRYGFHATLKPPFALREEDAGTALSAALAEFADGRAAFDMPPLAVGLLGDFVALRPVGADADACAPGRSLRELADECVRRFDAFRRPLSNEEAARRLGPGLDARQREFVARWGYPHVFEHWRFHMTLSDSLPGDAEGDALRATLLDDASRHFATALAPPLRCDGLALFVEDAPGAAFRLARRFRFAR